MIRATTLSVALLGMTLLVPEGATAAGATCQGVPATHVGSANVYELEGTEGPDVIVTNGAQDVRGLGGSDLVCVTVALAEVDAGAGDDEVQSFIEGRFGPHTQLGPGSDRSPSSILLDGQVRCGTRRARLDGGPGADTLRGHSGNDLLIGGPGRDLAIGSAGRDTCRAERTRTCEVRR